MKTMFAITHVNGDGRRTLTFANQGRNHYETSQAAQQALWDYEPDLRAKVIGAAADTLEVRPVRCYDHGDAVGIYFD
jgi:hypothetical protein